MKVMMWRKIKQTNKQTCFTTIIILLSSSSSAETGLCLLSYFLPASIHEMNTFYAPLYSPLNFGAREQ